MDKQKEIEKMTTALNSLYKSDTHKFATALVNAGYGDVRQAVREFAEKLKSLAHRQHYYITGKDIDKLLSEVCGDE